MGKIAFVFSGQGAQYSGMGKELYAMGGEIKALYDAAESFRPGTMAQSFEGTEEELRLTKNTQPCLYLVDLSKRAYKDIILFLKPVVKAREIAPDPIDCSFAYTMFFPVTNKIIADIFRSYRADVLVDLL